MENKVNKENITPNEASRYDYSVNLEGAYDDSAVYDESAAAVASATSNTTQVPTVHPDGCRCDECFRKWAEENPEAFEHWLLAYLDSYYLAHNQAYISNQTISPRIGTSGKYNNEHINLFNGQLTYKHDDIATSGALANVSVTHYYNSSNCSDGVEHNCGKGWRMSIQQSIRESEHAYCDYIYTDAMGKEHYFVNTPKKGIIDTGGLNLRYSGTIRYGSYITDRNGNKMTFSSSGKLVKVSDKNGNTVRYTYENGLITKATDSFGKELTFIYDSNNMLSEIRDPKLRSVKFNYSCDGMLTEIIEPDGKMVTYTYDSNNHLTEALTSDGVKTVYTYESGSDRIIRTDKYATIAKTAHGTQTEADTPEAGEYTIFEYRGRRSTAVSDRSGIKHVYVFDDYGRCMYEYEDSLVDGTQERGQITGTVVHSYANQKRVFESSLVATDEENPNFIKNNTFDGGTENGSAPEDWTKTGGSNADCITDTVCIDETHSFMFSADCAGEKYLSQKVDITNITYSEDAGCVEITGNDKIIKYGDTLILSAWAKSQCIYDEIWGAKFEIRAVAEYNWGDSEEFSAQYDPTLIDWQYMAIPIRVDRNRKLKSVTVYLDCSYNPNNIYFDNVRLVNALANSVEYEEDLDESIFVLGSHVSLAQKITTHDGIYTTVIENNRSYMPVRVTVTDLHNNSFVTVNKYDSNRNLIATQDYRGMVTLNEYTDNGQLLRSRSYHSENFNTSASLTCPAECFVKEYTYDTNGEFMISESDNRSSDICTLYDYNRNDGSLNHVTDPSGVRTTYAYDNATGALTMVSSTVGGQNVSVAYGYTNRLLTDITHNGFDYLFEYDGFGRQTQINVGGDMFARNTYTLTDTTTVTTTYANNDSLTVTTDRHQAPISKSYTKSDRVTYEEDNTDVHTTDYGAEYTTQTITAGYTDILITNEYDELGKLTKAIDNCTETEYNYRYNGIGNIEGETRNGVVFKTLEYDRHNRLAETTINTSDETLVYTPIYETRDSDNAIYADNAIKGMSLDGIFEQSVDKDKYGRPIKASLKVGTTPDELLASEYTYLTSNSRLTNIVDSVTHKVNGYESEKFAYTYDVKGNITAIVKVSEAETNPEEEYDECGNPICPEPSEPITETIAEYVYDEQNRLTRENNYALGKTYTYSYDKAGNILSKSTYDVTSGAVVTPTDVKLYTYLSTGWKDKLVNYDGTAIAYDMVGNPWYYRGHNLEWDRIRLLTKWDDIIIDYNASGIRTRKGDTYYELDGDSIISETTNGNTIRYYYGNGGIVGFRYNGVRYYYEKNLQGDIIAIYNGDGDKLCEYVYDAWGNCTIKNDISDARIGEVNSFRYRGYYYDSDLGLYYLKSRYYDAVTGRFINADEIEYLGAGNDLGAYNLFAYCGNKPIDKIDKTGNFGLSLAIFIGASAVIGGLAGAFTAACTGGNVLEGALEGAALGAVAATATILAPIMFPAASVATTVGATFILASAGGVAVDYTVQRVSHSMGENSQEEFDLDTKRLLKTGFTTGIAGVVPTYGNPQSSTINALGSLAMGFDASIINSAVEIILTNIS